MKLHLIRHAKTNQLSPTGRDFDRALLPKGNKQVDLLKKEISINDDDLIFSSSAKRTKQTVEALLEPSRIQYLDELYLCSSKEYLRLIWKQPTSNDLWIIGHNYGISELANYFLETDLEMRTSEYVCIEFETDNWAETFRGTGVLTNRYRPIPD